jgi:acetylornithine deacetylase
MEHLVKQVQADAAIVTEPTDLMIGAAHRGFIWFEVETFGRVAHGSRFKEGIDANMRMGRFLSCLEGLERELRARPPHPLTGPPSLHVARLQGGREISIYADHCLCQIERRTVPGETVEGATAEVQAILDELVREDQTFKASVKATFDRDAFETQPGSRIVETLDRVVSSRSRAPAAYCGQTFWTDAALLASAGMDAVLLGPTGFGLHSQEEWVELQSVIELAQILAETALAYCKQP